MKKKKIMEILDANEVIIGSDDKPQVDPNADTEASGTTDRNAKISHQPFDDKFWGTFGFSLYEEISEEKLTKLAEEIISKRTDKSINNKAIKTDLVSTKKRKIKDLFADLSDREKGDLVKALKNEQSIKGRK